MKNKYSTFETVLDVITAIFIVVGICSNALIFLWALLTIVFAIVCKKIGESKGIDYGFLLGWFLGILGLIIIAVLPNKDLNENSSNDRYENLAKLHELKINGVITEKEFEEEKLKLLK